MAKGGYPLTPSCFFEGLDQVTVAFSKVALVGGTARESCTNPFLVAHQCEASGSGCRSPLPISVYRWEKPVKRISVRPRKLLEGAPWRWWRRLLACFETRPREIVNTRLYRTTQVALVAVTGSNILNDL